MQTLSLPSCGCKCTCYVKIQGGNFHISILHGSKTCSATLFPHTLFSLSCLSLSFLPLGFLIRSINRFVFQQMELKTSTVSPFLNNMVLMQMGGKNTGRKQWLSASICEYLKLCGNRWTHGQEHRQKNYAQRQVLRRSELSRQHDINSDMHTPVQKHRHTDGLWASIWSKKKRKEKKR